MVFHQKYFYKIYLVTDNKCNLHAKSFFNQKVKLIFPNRKYHTGMVKRPNCNLFNSFIQLVHTLRQPVVDSIDMFVLLASAGDDFEVILSVHLYFGMREKVEPVPKKRFSHFKGIP